MPSRPLLSVALVLALVLAATLPQTLMAYESPPYVVEQSNADFELRRYAPYLVAETEVAGGFEESRNAAFRRLFNYITGTNQAQQKIDMTVPVVTAPSEKIEMTAPVITQPAGADSRLMQFALPARYTIETAPRPVDPAVRIRLLPEQWVAVRRYSGTWSERNFAENEAALLAAVNAAGLKIAGPSRFAAYNGPFTPWFLRRNEVMLPVQRPS